MSKKSAKLFRVYSWNVNGIRSVAKKGLADWMGKARADVIGMQETRVLPEQLPPEVHKPKRWRSHFVSALRKGYSGVGMYSRREPDHITAMSLGEDRFDHEGRLQLARFGGLTIVNGYFPNGSGKNRDHSRVPYKLDFYQKLYALLDEGKKRGDKILVMGSLTPPTKRSIWRGPSRTRKPAASWTSSDKSSTDGFKTAGPTPFASLRVVPSTTRGGATASAFVKRTSGGASTICSLRRD